MYNIIQLLELHILRLNKGFHGNIYIGTQHHYIVFALAKYNGHRYNVRVDQSILSNRYIAMTLVAK